MTISNQMIGMVIRMGRIFIFIGRAQGSSLPLQRRALSHEHSMAQNGVYRRKIRQTYLGDFEGSLGYFYGKY